MVVRKVVVQSNTGHNEVIEEGDRIRFQVEEEDELFGEEEVADTVAPDHLQPVPRLRRHPWVEVGFDFHAVEVLLVVEVHK